jgi:hypothetical protein
MLVLKAVVGLLGAAAQGHGLLIRKGSICFAPPKAARSSRGRRFGPAANGGRRRHGFRCGIRAGRTSQAPNSCDSSDDELAQQRTLRAGPRRCFPVRSPKRPGDPARGAIAKVAGLGGNRAGDRGADPTGVIPGAVGVRDLVGDREHPDVPAEPAQPRRRSQRMHPARSAHQAAEPAATTARGTWHQGRCPQSRGAFPGGRATAMEDARRTRQAQTSSPRSSC